MWLLLANAHAVGLSKLPSFEGPGPGAPPQVVQPAGDLDGDGLGDLAVGVPEDDTAGNEAGAVYLIYGTEFSQVDGNTPLVDIASRLTGEEPQDGAGRDLAALDDTDDDGYDDVAVSAYEASWDQVQAGKVHILFGNATRIEDGTLDDRPTIHGVESDDRVGARVFPSQDLDGDGRTEILIGVPYPNAAGDPSPGWLALLFGRNTRWPDDTRVDVDISADSEGTTVDAAFFINKTESYGGRAATVVPDQDEDGIPDILVGAPGFDAGLDETTSGIPVGNAIPGAAFLFSMRDRTELAADGVYRETDAIGVIGGNDLLSGFPWILTTLPDGRVAAAVPEANFGQGAVLIFDSLLGEHTEDDADERWDGGTSDLTGWGMANAYDLDDDSLLIVGEPGWGDGRGRVRFIGGATETSFEGCGPIDLAGSTIRSHPGPDPDGDDAAWAGISAPGEGIWYGGTGRGYVMTQYALAGISGDCPEDVVPEVDGDGDGWLAGEDCDDATAWRFPGALEVCGDDVDDDCDGEADESCEDAPGGGCATAPGMAGSLLPLLFAVRRRR